MVSNCEFLKNLTAIQSIISIQNVKVLKCYKMLQNLNIPVADIARFILVYRTPSATTYTIHILVTLWWILSKVDTCQKGKWILTHNRRWSHWLKNRYHTVIERLCNGSQNVCNELLNMSIGWNIYGNMHIYLRG